MICRWYTWYGDGVFIELFDAHVLMWAAYELELRAELSAELARTQQQ